MRCLIDIFHYRISLKSLFFSIFRFENAHQSMIKRHRDKNVELNIKMRDSCILFMRWISLFELSLKSLFEGLCNLYSCFSYVYCYNYVIEVTSTIKFSPWFNSRAKARFLLLVYSSIFSIKYIPSRFIFFVLIESLDDVTLLFNKKQKNWHWKSKEGTKNEITFLSSMRIICRRYLFLTSINNYLN